MADFADNEGMIWLEGESWAAKSAAPIAKNQRVLVTAMDGLVLSVEPVTEASASDAHAKPV